MSSHFKKYTITSLFNIDKYIGTLLGAPGHTRSKDATTCLNDFKLLSTPSPEAGSRRRLRLCPHLRRPRRWRNPAVGQWTSRHDAQSGARVTSATLVVTSALLLVTKKPIRIKKESR